MVIKETHHGTKLRLTNFVSYIPKETHENNKFIPDTVHGCASCGERDRPACACRIQPIREGFQDAGIPAQEQDRPPKLPVSAGFCSIETCTVFDLQDISSPIDMEKLCLDQGCPSHF